MLILREMFIALKIKKGVGLLAMRRRKSTWRTIVKAFSLKIRSELPARESVRFTSRLLVC